MNWTKDGNNKKDEGLQGYILVRSNGNMQGLRRNILELGAVDLTLIFLVRLHKNRYMLLDIARWEKLQL